MPADRFTNFLDSANYSKGQSLKGSLNNRNQLVSSSDFRAFNIELDHQVAKTLVSQAAATARQQSRQNDSSSGNRLPTQDRETAAQRERSDSNRRSIDDSRSNAVASERRESTESTHSSQSTANHSTTRNTANQNRTDKNRSTAESDVKNNVAESADSSNRQVGNTPSQEAQGQQHVTTNSGATPKSNDIDDSNLETDQAADDIEANLVSAEKQYELDLSQKLLSDSVLLDDQIENAELIEQQLQQQKIVGDKFLSEELVKQMIAAQMSEAGLESGGQLQTPEEIALPSELNLLLQQVMSAKSEDGLSDPSLDQIESNVGLEQALNGLSELLPKDTIAESDNSVGLVSIAERLQALLGGQQIESDVAVISDGEIQIDAEKLLDSEAALNSAEPIEDIKAALTEIEALLAELALPAADKQALLKDINNLKVDLANTEAKAVNGDALKAVVAQLEQVKKSTNQTSFNLAPAKANIDSGDSAAKTLDLTTDLDGQEQFSNKLDLKSGKGIDVSNMELAAGKDKALTPDQLMQKLGAMVDQLRGSVKEGRVQEQVAASVKSTATSSASASPLVGVTKPAELQSAQAAANNKPLTMTMQQHFSKPGWGSELGQRLMMMVGQKIQVAEIRLDPPDLGPMEVKVRMQHEQANVVFSTQHTAVKDALEQALPRLKEMFEQNGLSLGDVDVQDQTQQNQDGEDDASDGQGSAELIAGENEGESEETVTKVVHSDRIVDFYA
ncbi:MAG: flagellar hook-length control protein FliK [Pseudomonadales bacterium]|nr:flagellar hook-length control protein FliK [Pseudomonadales bacterium]